VNEDGKRQKKKNCLFVDKASPVKDLKEKSQKKGDRQEVST
jgi:hypothetical protein